MPQIRHLRCLSLSRRSAEVKVFFCRAASLFLLSDLAYNRYTKALHRLLERKEVGDELSARGLRSSDLGSHSTRKGASSFVSSGSTACPSHTAITLRCGWKQAGVENRYLKYEAAGDQFVGRAVCGLPMTDHRFATLPPHFAVRQAHAVKTCFPMAPQSLSLVLEMCLASLLFHKAFLSSTLGANHPVFSCPIYTDAIICELSKNVICNDDPSDWMKPTGIPPYVSILKRLDDHEEKSAKILQAVQGLPHQVAIEVDEILEQKAVGAGTVTFQGLENMIRHVMRDAGLADAVNALKQPAVTSSSSSTVAVTPITPPNNVEGMYPVYWYDGKVHLFPQTFRLPKGTALHAWQLFMCGDATKGYPPLRKLTSADVGSDKNQRKRFSDYKFLMEKIEAKARQESRWNPQPSLTQANEMFEVGETAIFPSEPLGISSSATSPVTRKRRRGQMKWTTLVKLNRLAKKARVENNAV